MAGAALDPAAAYLAVAEQRERFETQRPASGTEGYNARAAQNVGPAAAALDHWNTREDLVAAAAARGGAGAGGGRGGLPMMGLPRVAAAAPAPARDRRTFHRGNK